MLLYIDLKILKSTSLCVFIALLLCGYLPVAFFSCLMFNWVNFKFNTISFYFSAVVNSTVVLRELLPKISLIKLSSVE